MWVQLTTAQHLDIDGVQRTYQPGDWVNVGRQYGLRMISRDVARTTVPLRTISADRGAGVMLLHDSSVARGLLSRWGVTVPVSVDGRHRVEYEMTMIWNPNLALRLELIPAGFHLLERWQMAVPLHSYEELARDIGTEEDRERTAAVVRDLRVPVYDTRLMFVKKCRDTEWLMAVWEREMGDHGDERLAFLRALYQVKPLILALPSTWKGDKW